MEIRHHRLVGYFLLLRPDREALHFHDHGGQAEPSARRGTHCPAHSTGQLGVNCR